MSLILKSEEKKDIMSKLFFQLKSMDKQVSDKKIYIDTCYWKNCNCNLKRESGYSVAPVCLILLQIRKKMAALDGWCPGSYVITQCLQNVLRGIASI
jgi:hypothetical protein